MNQERIGKFIAKIRKENKLTQQDLAEKLGVSDRTIGNWENGRNLPDLSLFKPLCNELGITINELISGERLSKQQYQDKLEENIINTIDYSSEKIKRVKKNKILLITLTIIVTIFSIILLDTIQAVIFKNSPIISWKEEQFDEDSYVDRGILIDTYYCVKDGDIMTIIPTFKTTNYGCPIE